jgi:transposase-like protein
MEAEISVATGAELGEVSEARVTHRDGYRSRDWETRVGEIELLIPKKRRGPAYFPGFLEPRRRSGQTIVAVVTEAYVNGVSTRKIDRLVEQFGIAGMTKDRLSALCRGLDEAGRVVPAVPAGGRVAVPVAGRQARQGSLSKELVVAYAVHESGVREIIGLDIGEVESGSFCVEFLRSLKSVA